LTQRERNSQLLRLKIYRFPSTLLKGITMLKTILAATLAFVASSVFALDIKPYAADQLAAAQKAGKSVAVHFHADWCPTCVNQAKALNVLKADAQLKDVMILVADYDKEKELRKSMKVRSQSTFVVYKGVAEVSRIAGDTEAEKIKIGLAKSL
jgi:thioredoxin 1